jgi:all-trans-8'-apo-beta-carotenal 15,15'-oxygenase
MTSTNLKKSTASPSFDLHDWQKGYRSLKQELSYPIDDIEGQIPLELEGTLFRNGPGLLDIGGHPIQHPFDGDGMVCAIAFSEGRAFFRNRFVRTEGYVAEQQAQKPMFRGVFGTQKPGGWLANIFDLKFKNIANTNVIFWGGKLLALWEAAEPHRLDPQTLETLGIDYLGGTLKPGDAFSAHPRVDPACALDNGAPCLVNFSIKPGLSTTITIYELDATGALVRKHSHSVPGFAFIHDFAITPNYCIFFQNPVSFNPLPVALGLKGAGECISLRQNQPTQIIVIPRHGTEPMRTLAVEAGFVFHHANAFEQDGMLYIDSISYADFPTVPKNESYLEVKFAALPPGQLWRFRLDLTKETVERELIEPRCCEFPALHPDHMGRPYRYMYIGAAHEPMGNAPLQAILKLDLETGARQLWSAAPRGFVGEPVFVPRPGSLQEDEGWVLVMVFNAERDRSELVILDARDLTRKPLATLRLKNHVPYGLHGSFTPGQFNHD